MTRAKCMKKRKVKKKKEKILAILAHRALGKTESDVWKTLAELMLEKNSKGVNLQTILLIPT